MATPKMLALVMTPELKPIAPFIQRAEELKDKEPIMAYWCAYHAAQIGISLKAKDTPSRNILFELLGALELLKKKIGPNESIDIESASAAYVENFAFKVFAMADNEDRSGKGNRSTAKKFLAAANFLEVLKVFPITEMSEGNEEKIRYAKWKAADIAKAYREGRQPTPGPADSGIELPSFPEIPGRHPDSPSGNTVSSVDTVHEPPDILPSTGRDGSPPQPHNSPTDFLRANRPPDVIVDEANSGGLLVPPHSASGEVSPGNWSTAATPGTGGISPNHEPQSGWDTNQPSPNRKAWVTEELEDEHGDIKAGKRSKGHLTPPALDITSPTGSVQDHAVFPESTTSPVVRNLPPGFVTGSQVIPPPAPPQIYAPVQPPTNLYAAPSAPPVHVPKPTRASAPPQSVIPLDLTPAVMAKAQKHCRFAVSSLDYEDVDQAKKELRAALALLGG